MGPFKQKLSVSQNDWLLNHPGRTIRIHDLASKVTPAYNSSFTPNNITAGFKNCGIFPFSRNAFTNEAFDCSWVTNRSLNDISYQSSNNDNNKKSYVDFKISNVSDHSIVKTTFEATVPNNKSLNACKNLTDELSQKVFNKRFNHKKNLVMPTVSSSTCMRNKSISCLQKKISLNCKDKPVAYTEKLKTNIKSWRFLFSHALQQLTMQC